MAVKKEKSTEIEIPAIRRDVARINILGTSPLILNRLSEKAKHELLFPRGAKNAAEKAATLKHDPLAEYRASPNRISDPAAPTLLAMPAVAFKGALRSAAVDVPGTAKAQIGRLTYVEGEWTGIYGKPQMLMTPVRSADMNRTPDIRTRAIVPHWAATISVHFMSTIIKEQSIVNLLAMAGLTIGVGDWRPEKGSGNYGQFVVGVADDDPAFKSIVEGGGRAVQEAAMEDPEFYDIETEELYSWFSAEVRRRGFKAAA